MVSWADELAFAGAGLTVIATDAIVHFGRKIVLAEARLVNGGDGLPATASANCFVVRL